MPSPALLSRPAYQDTYLGMSGLVLYVPLTSATDSRDRVGGGVGTISGTVSQGGAIPSSDSGGSARFTGVAGSKIVGTNANLPTTAAANCTWAAWVYMTGSAAETCLFGFGTTGAPGNGAERGLIRYLNVIRLWGQNADVAAAVDFNLNVPQLIVCTKTGSTTAQLWRNGVSLGSSGALTFNNCTTDWYVANKNFFANEVNNTSISHFAVWNRVLTQGEISYLYQQGMG